MSQHNPNISSIQMNILSKFTLALLSDTPWYSVDMSAAQSYPIGYLASCSYYNDPSVYGFFLV